MHCAKGWFQGGLTPHPEELTQVIQWTAAGQQINRSDLEWVRISFMGSMLNIFFECSCRENMGSPSACSPHLLYYPWWPGKTAQKKAAGLALSVPQVFYDWP